MPVQAACSEDGVVRVYEAADVMNLSNWSQVVGHIIFCDFIILLALYSLSHTHMFLAIKIPLDRI